MVILVCFDLLVYELFGILVEGGMLYLVENLFSLLDYLCCDEISLFNIVFLVCVVLFVFGDLLGGVCMLNLVGELLCGYLV